MSIQRPEARPTPLVLSILLFAGYLLLAWASTPKGNFEAGYFWPPLGFAIIAIYCLGTRGALSIFLSAITFQLLAASLLEFPPSWSQSIFLPLCACVGAIFLRRSQAFELRLSRLFDFFQLALLSILLSLITAALHASLNSESFLQPFLWSFFTNMSACFILSVTTSVWIDYKACLKYQERWLEALAFAMGFMLLAFSPVVIGTQIQLAIPILSQILVPIVAVRFGLHGVSLAITAASFCALMGGLGHSSTEASVSYALLLYLTLNAIVGFVIAFCFRRGELAREELLRSEERLKIALEGAQEALWDWDLEKDLMEYSEEFSEILGYPTGVLSGPAKRWVQIVHSEDRPELQRLLGEHLAGRSSSFEYEHRLLSQSGRYVWVRACGRVNRRDANGRATRVAGTMTSVEEKHKAQEVLQEREKQCRQLVEGLHSIVWEYDLELDRYTFVSPLAESLNGRTAEEWCTRGFWPDCVHDEDREWVIRSSAKSVSERKDFELEYRLKHASGLSPVWVRDIVSVRTDKNGVLRLSGVKVDITAQRQAKEDLKTTEERYRQVFEATNDGILILDHKGMILDANCAACSMHGYGEKELIGTNLKALMSPEESGKLKDLMENLQATKSFVQTETHIREDASTLEVELQGAPLHYRQDWHVLAILRDVTEKRRAEQKRSDLEAQLRHSQKMEALGQLAGGVAHDFNNLLTAILGNSSYLLSRTKSRLEEPHADVRAQSELTATKQIQQAGERAARLTKQLLAFGRKQVFQESAVDVALIVQSMEDMLHRILGEKIALSIFLPTHGVLGIRADAGQVEQVLVNLVVNARDSMPSGGSISIKVEYLDLDEDYVNRHVEARSGNHLCISIRDTGMGMDQHTMAHALEPFFTTKAVGKGTGLGLSTVYGIVRQAGGHMRLLSALGKGTEVRVLFPAISQLEEGADQQNMGEAKGGECILVCEDEIGVRQMLCQVLSSNGYHVLESDNGRHGLEVADAYPGHIDLLLTDVIMPEMNGRELAEELAARRPEIGVLFISGYAKEVVASSSDLMVAFDFLEKPFAPALLLQNVRALLDRKAGRA